MSMDQKQSSTSPNGALYLTNIHLKLASQAGEVNILRGIDLNIHAGETVGVVGPSGSGKTSLLMIMAGLERPTSGTIQAAGTEISTLDEDGLAIFRRDNIGIVFQNFHLISTMTALENVAIPLEFAGKADAFEHAEEHLNSVGLSHRITHYPGQLSGGEQQRVALARACAAEPSVLLADEPTGNLDRETGRKIMDLLFELHDRLGTTLILVTHEAALANECTRVLHLADGLIVKDEARPAVT
jgi:putative ABC transport system ATP-binding protein